MHADGHPAILDVKAYEVLPWDRVDEGRVVAAARWDGYQVELVVVDDTYHTLHVDGVLLRTPTHDNPEVRTFEQDDDVRVMRWVNPDDADAGGSLGWASPRG